MKKRVKNAILLGAATAMCISMTGCSILLKDQPINQKVIKDESSLASGMVYVWHSNNDKSLETVVKERQDSAFENKNTETKQESTESVGTEASTEELIDDYSFTKVYYDQNSATFINTENFTSGYVDTISPKIQWVKTENEDEIPTLYPDDALVYYSDSTLPMEFEFDRFLDNGYTFGIAGLKIEDNGKCTYDLTSNLLMNSDREGLLTNLNNKGDQKIIVKTIGDKAITAKNLDEYGAVKGLQKGKSYDVVVYKGTIKRTTTYTSDKKMLVYDGEQFNIDNYDLLNNNTAVIHIPDYCPSGYYFVDNVGFIRYIAADDIGKKTKDINFNQPIPVLEDDTENNTEYDTEQQDTEQGTEVPDEESTEPMKTATDNGMATIYTYNLDNDAKVLSIAVTYNESENSDGFLSSPYAIVKDSSGNELLRIDANGGSISGQLQDLQAGQYTIEVYDLFGRESNCAYDVQY